MFFRLINHGYKLFSIVKRFCSGLLWAGSCVALLFFLPIFFEIQTEQMEVLDKI